MPSFMAIVIFALLFATPAVTQVSHASPQATPAPTTFMLVATIAADEWHDPLPEPARGVDLGESTLLEALRAGGFVIYIRHAATDTSYDQNVDLERCATQRNLSQHGRDQSIAIGEGFLDLGIPIGEVHSSEFCRTVETAELAFGDVTREPGLTPFTNVGQGEDAVKYDALRSLLSTPPAEGTNTVLVAHQFNITGVAGLELDEGESAIFLPLE